MFDHVFQANIVNEYLVDSKFKLDSNKYLSRHFSDI